MESLSHCSTVFCLIGCIVVSITLLTSEVQFDLYGVADMKKLGLKILAWKVALISPRMLIKLRIMYEKI